MACHRVKILVFLLLLGTYFLFLCKIYCGYLLNVAVRPNKSLTETLKSRNAELKVCANHQTVFLSPAERKQCLLSVPPGHQLPTHLFVPGLSWSDHNNIHDCDWKYSHCSTTLGPSLTEITDVVMDILKQLHEVRTLLFMRMFILMHIDRCKVAIRLSIPLTGVY